MTPDPVLLLSATRLRELHEEAHRHALVRLATCCRPSALRAALTRLTEHRRGRAEACCA